MAKGNGSVNSIADVASVDSVDTAVTPKRAMNPNLEGVRANINKNVVAQLNTYSEQTSLERAIVIEMALRVFFTASKEARVAAYDALIKERVPDKATIL